MRLPTLRRGRRNAPGADDRMLRRAWLTVALQTTLAVTILLVTMAAAVLVLNQQQVQAQAERTARSAFSADDEVWEAPKNVWLMREQNGQRQVTPGSPYGLNGLSAHDLPDGPATVRWNDYHLLIWTGDTEYRGRVSAVYDMSLLDAEESRLKKSLALGCGLGVLGAAFLGALIGRRAVRPLGAALAVQRRFVADASHELRTPLTVLLTRAQLLRRKVRPDTDEAVTRDVDRLVADARALNDVVQDLLIAAESGRGADSGERVELGPLAEDVARSMEALGTERGVEIRTGPVDEECAVRGAPVALRRAVTALVDNAVAHTPAGGHIEIRVVGGSGGTVWLTVADNGEGLDPAQASRLVQRFARGTTQDAGRRFGLGLALVDEVARSHGGTLVIDGAIGAGATFTLRLPRAPREQTAPEASRARRWSRRPSTTT